LFNVLQATLLRRNFDEDKGSRLNLTDKPKLDFARDLFLLSFFLRGMSFVDLCLLKKSDSVGGVLSYRRQKTGQLMQVKWEKPMHNFSKKLGQTGTIYLLPIIKEDGTDRRRQYENALRRENRNLKRIGKMIGLETPLTTYVARHIWASVAKSKNVSINAISEGLVYYVPLVFRRMICVFHIADSFLRTHIGASFMSFR